MSRDEFKERVRQSRAPFPDQRFELQEVLADRRAVAATWLWTGIDQDVRATVYYFEGDRIVEHWQISDRLGVFQQLQSTQ